MKQVLKTGAVYFAIVFGVGFFLGVIRTLWVVPLVGTRTAELLEAPIMLGVTILSARWVARRFRFPATWPKRLESGVVALALMLFAEFGFVLWVRGITIHEYFETRDPVSGTVYLVTLAAFTLVPAFVGSKPSKNLP
jgi:hypothetical protein